MAKTNAENQAAYKNRHLKDVSGTSERLDVLAQGWKSPANLAVRVVASSR
jgi:tRNA pseudouridine-54 N-methylase